MADPDVIVNNLQQKEGRHRLCGGGSGSRARSRRRHRRRRQTDADQGGGSSLRERLSKRVPCLSAWIIFVAATTTYFAAIGPEMVELAGFWIMILHAFLVFFVTINFSLVTFMDPGYFTKATNDENEQDDVRSPLYKSVEINGTFVRMKWCTTCQFYRPPRCSHCSSCDFCVDTFDHHCPWLNNCVGRRNYRFFVQFLVSIAVHMLVVFGTCLFYVLQQRDRARQLKVILAGCLMTVITVLAIPVGGLSGFHFYLIARGRTTNEQVTGKFKANANPFDQGCLGNFIQIFCASLSPSPLSYDSFEPSSTRWATNQSENQINPNRRFKPVITTVSSSMASPNYRVAVVNAATISNVCANRGGWSTDLPSYLDENDVGNTQQPRQQLYVPSEISV